MHDDQLDEVHERIAEGQEIVFEVGFPVKVERSACVAHVPQHNADGHCDQNFLPNFHEFLRNVISCGLYSNCRYI